MQVRINPRQVLPRLRALTPLVGRHYPSPILETVRLDATPDGRGTLRATDLEAGAEVEVPLLKVIRPGVAQLPHRAITKAIADAKAGSVEIEGLPPETLPLAADPKLPSRKVAVVTPSTLVTLPTFDPQYFPGIAVAEPTHAVEVPAWKLRRLIARTQFAADEHATRYALRGCAFEFADGTLHAIATDGRGLAHAFEHAAGSGLIAPPAARVGGEVRPLAPVVSSRALKALAALLETFEYAGLTLGFTPDGWFRVQGPGLVFVARLLEGQFPTWKQVFPRPSETAARVTDPKRLLRALKEAARYTTWDRRAVELRLRGHELTVAVENALARTTRAIAVRNLSEAPEGEASVVIDPAHLLGYLAAETRPFVLSFPPEEGTPLVCQAEGFRYALMPLEQPERPTTGVPAPGPLDRPDATDSQQEPEREAPPQDEALSA